LWECESKGGLTSCHAKERKRVFKEKRDMQPCLNWEAEEDVKYFTWHYVAYGSKGILGQ